MPNSPVDVNSWEESACYPRRTFYPLSDGPSIQNHRITMACFRTCSTCQSRSQARLCHYTIQYDFRPYLANLRAPPLLFGRRPPQSNCLPCTVPTPDKGGQVRTTMTSGWYFNVASMRASAPTSQAPTYPTQIPSQSNAKLQ